MSNIACSPEAVALPPLPDLTVLAISAIPVTGFPIPQTEVPNQGVFPPGAVDFCNVTITIAPSDIDDQAIVEVWLPSNATWNDRILAVGGGGHALGRIDYAEMAGVVAQGFATYTTDGGLAQPLEPVTWALDADGELDEAIIAYWGYGSLRDMTSVGKSVVSEFYGKSADYSYYSGCSQGGRQGYDLAQSFPAEYDGIAAAAPAIRVHEIFTSWQWPQVLMNKEELYPYGCALDSLTALAIAACDGDDGIVDGIISDPHACDFNPYDAIGSPAVLCASPNSTFVSEAAAFVANAVWGGIRDKEGNKLFPGLHRGADMSGLATGAGIAATTCEDVGEECAGAPLPPIWIQIFLLEDPEFDTATLTLEQYHQLLQEPKAFFDPLVGANNPDLSAFKETGGKLLTYHGLVDQGIPTDLTRDYYERALQVDPDASDFFRYFEVPALPHCTGNGHPTGAFQALMDWVEKGVAPASLATTVTDSDGKANERIVCPYPQKTVYVSECGDASSAECFKCVTQRL